MWGSACAWRGTCMRCEDRRRDLSGGPRRLGTFRRWPRRRGSWRRSRRQARSREHRRRRREVVAAAAGAGRRRAARSRRSRSITPVTEPPPLTLSKRELKASLATLLDEAVVANRHPTRRAHVPPAARARWPASARRSTARGFTEIQTPKLVAIGHRGRRQRLHARLLRPPGLPGAEPAVLQADHGRRLRARLRGRAGLPRRAARHAAPPQRVRQPRRRAGLHRGPLHRDGDAARRARRHARRRCASAAPPSWRCWASTLPEVPAEIPHIHFAEAQELISRLHGEDVRGEPDLAPQDERWLGEWARARARQRLPVRHRLPDAQAAVLHASRIRRGPSTRTRSTCSSAAPSW